MLILRCYKRKLGYKLNQENSEVLRKEPTSLVGPAQFFALSKQWDINFTKTHIQGVTYIQSIFGCANIQTVLMSFLDPVRKSHSFRLFLVNLFLAKGQNLSGKGYRYFKILVINCGHFH